MNLAVIRGCLSRAPELRELPSGTQIAHLEVTIRDVAPADSVPVVWIDPPRAWANLVAGDEIVAAGRVRRRFFRTRSGTGSRTEIVADRVVPARQARRVQALLDRAADQLAAVSG
jgi:hypothetical protein